MKIEIRPLQCFNDNSMHLKISTPSGECYNFMVEEEIDGFNEYSSDYPYSSLLELHKILDNFINGKK